MKIFIIIFVILIFISTPVYSESKKWLSLDYSTEYSSRFVDDRKNDAYELEIATDNSKDLVYLSWCEKFGNLKEFYIKRSNINKWVNVPNIDKNVKTDAVYAGITKKQIQTNNKGLLHAMWIKDKNIYLALLSETSTRNADGSFDFLWTWKTIDNSEVKNISQCRLSFSTGVIDASLYFDNNQNPVVIWSIAQNNESSVNYAIYTNNSWRTIKGEPLLTYSLVNPSIIGNFTSDLPKIAYNKDNNPVFVWDSRIVGQEEFYCKTWDDGRWVWADDTSLNSTNEGKPIFKIRPIGFDNVSFNLTLDSNDLPHICWSQIELNISQYKVYYARFLDGKWRGYKNTDFENDINNYIFSDSAYSSHTPYPTFVGFERDKVDELNTSNQVDYPIIGIIKKGSNSDSDNLIFYKYDNTSDHWSDLDKKAIEISSVEKLEGKNFCFALNKNGDPSVFYAKKSTKSTNSNSRQLAFTTWSNPLPIKNEPPPTIIKRFQYAGDDEYFLLKSNDNKAILKFKIRNSASSDNIFGRLRFEVRDKNNSPLNISSDQLIKQDGEISLEIEVKKYFLRYHENNSSETNRITITCIDPEDGSVIFKKDAKVYFVNDCSLSLEEKEIVDNRLAFYFTGDCNLYIEKTIELKCNNQEDNACFRELKIESCKIVPMSNYFFSNIIKVERRDDSSIKLTASFIINYSKIPSNQDQIPINFVLTCKGFCLDKVINSTLFVIGKIKAELFIGKKDVVILNGTNYFPKVTLNTEPYINSKNRAMVPTRFIELIFKKYVSYDNISKTVAIYLCDNVVYLFKVGLNQCIIMKGASFEVLPLPIEYVPDQKYVPELKSNVTFLPLRFISEQLGFKNVTWDRKLKKITISQL